MDLLSIFETTKTLITSITHIQRDALHVHVGLVMFLGMAVVFRGERRFRHAFVALAALTLLGEAFDTINRLSDGKMPGVRDSVKDIFNTLLWPWLLYRFGGRLAGLLGLSVFDRIGYRRAEVPPQTFSRPG